jgi:hypothetical protein
MINVFISPDKVEYQCILYANDTNTEKKWYGFESSGNGIYFGLIQGEIEELGHFNINELFDAGIPVNTEPDDILVIQPPSGWKRKPE